MKDFNKDFKARERGLAVSLGKFYELQATYLLTFYFVFNCTFDMNAVEWKRFRSQWQL